MTATAYDIDTQGISGVELTVYQDGVSKGAITTDNSGVATYTYTGTGIGNTTFRVSANNVSSAQYVIEDCIYYLQTVTSNTIDLDIDLPSSFELEFTMNPISRATSDGGKSAYIRLGETSSSGVWLGQGNSAGNHGIMVRPSTNTWCASLSNIGVDNDVAVIYNSSTLTYICNGEMVTATINNPIKMNGIKGTNGHRLKNIKLKPL